MKTQTKILGKVSITTEGVYDPNRDYDRLSLVKTDKGEVYLSKQHVEPGVSIEDDRYWMFLVNSTVNNIQIIKGIENESFKINTNSLYIRNTGETIPEIRRLIRNGVDYLIFNVKTTLDDTKAATYWAYKISNNVATFYKKFCDNQSDDKAVPSWISNNFGRYDVATETSDGLMRASDKKRFNEVVAKMSFIDNEEDASHISVDSQFCAEQIFDESGNYLSEKANKDDVYSKTEIDDKLDNIPTAIDVSNLFDVNIKFIRNFHINYLAAHNLYVQSMGYTIPARVIKSPRGPLIMYENFIYSKDDDNNYIGSISWTCATIFDNENGIVSNDIFDVFPAMPEINT